jgi:CIC family chloride channel protein
VKGLLNWFVKQKLSRHVVNSILAIFIGILGALGAILFRFLIESFQDIFYHHRGDFLTFYQAVPFYLKIILPALGAGITGPIIYFLAKEAKGHGVPEVMEALVLRGGRIRARLAFLKMLVSSICIGSGGSVGREGPIVMIGSSAGSMVGQLVKAPQQRLRTFVGCGAAAGIAATFNAPIAGILFAIEILLADFRLEQFSPIVLSSVTATAICRHHFGNFPTLRVPSYQLINIAEFGFYTLLGIIAGIVAVLFVEALYESEDIFDKSPLPPYLRPALGGLLIGIILLLFPHVFGVGYGTINLALVGKLSWYLLFLLIIIKILATSLILGSGASGGIFAPSLFIGAMTGGAFGYFIHYFFPEITAPTGAYALVGMGAVVAGTTHGPITAILIIFELTGDYKIILPLMVSCVISTFITTSLKEGSIYTIKLKRRGLDIYRGLEQIILKTFKVKDVMREEIQFILEKAKFDEIIETFSKSRHSYLLVTNDQGELTGVISFHDVRKFITSRDESSFLRAKDIATKNIVSLIPADTLQTALRKISMLGVSQLPVVAEGNSKKVLGIVTSKDIITFYERQLVSRELV